MSTYSNGIFLRFSRLRLNGFKSFVDPTDLIITEGLTGVVGPNGCGKSNLLEALRWAMGENRPTAMRGGGMEDVIFAGTSTRPARNFAEVSLIIDNSDRRAPTAFNHSDDLEIVRRITRDIGSAYKANGKDIRARDVQMLFADASTGAHSPALVRQGQISQLINAKPKDRRRILEEAAGISGLYQRRHEAELKLNNAETNLTRVDDILAQLSTQLKALDRQAKQAAKYRILGAKLRRVESTLLYLRWSEAKATLTKTETILNNSMTLALKAENAVRKAAKAREEQETALPKLREQETVAQAVLERLNAQLGTLENEEQRAAGKITSLQHQIQQLTDDAHREDTLNRDAIESIAQLRAEKSALIADEQGHDAHLSQTQKAVAKARIQLERQEETLNKVTEDVARLAAHHQSAQQSIDNAQSQLTKAQNDGQKAKSEIDNAQKTEMKAVQAYQLALQDTRSAEQNVKDAEHALSITETACAACQTRENTARSARSQAQGIEATLKAEASALSNLIAQDTNANTQILDQITVVTGFEKALGAALSDDLKACIIDADGTMGWAELPDYTTAHTLPIGAKSFASYVTAPRVLKRRLQHIGLVNHIDGPRLQTKLTPGQCLVSKNGDLWRWDGLRTNAKDAPSAASLRLEQKNKLAQLKVDLAKASKQFLEKCDAYDTIKAQMATLTQANNDARSTQRHADRLVADTGRALSKAEAEQTLSKGRTETLKESIRQITNEEAEARIHLNTAQKILAELDDLDTARQKIIDIKSMVETARVTMMTHRAHLDMILRTGEDRQKRLSNIQRDLENWERRLQSTASRADELAQRRNRAEVDLINAKNIPLKLEKKRTQISQQQQQSESRKKIAVTSLAHAETILRDSITQERDTEHTASTARENRARDMARVDAAIQSVTTAAKRIADNLETTPDDLRKTLDLGSAPLPTRNALEETLDRLRRQRDALGAVNLRAEEDSQAIQTEHETLLQEKADLADAISALRSGIANLNKEGRERLRTAFDDVNINFGTLFAHLFGGGEANLVMVQSDDPLEAGLEIMCQPPGKKLSTLSLLSGGEQTLTALALIFAVFLANPAPICVLDEVDAPLDDANVTRFCDLLDEMTRRTQTRFLIITHHAITMTRMDRLFGVTMAEQGVSQLVSVDLKKAEQLTG